MPSIAGNVASTAQHIPAWKRLGLKLKFAKDLPIQSEDNSSNDAKSRKRKLGDGDSDGTELESLNPPKAKHIKRRSSSIPPLSLIEPAKASLRSDNSNGADASSVPLATPLRKRKSVAFTPETKLEDGDSTKQLFYAWVAEQIAKDSSFNPEALGGAFRTLEPRKIPEPGSEEKVKKPKSDKKKKPQQKTEKQIVPTISSTGQETATHPAVTYLQQYHESRAAWKFNKAKQTYILKNLFDIDKLPSSLDSALTAYIEGLQGVDARSRVRKAAEDIRAGDVKAKEAVLEENMEDPVRRQEYHDTALKHYKAQLKGQVKEKQDFEKELDPEWRLKFLKRKRAERILWSMGDALEVRDDAALQQRGALPSVDRSGANDGSNKILKTNDGAVPRKRKRRTGVPDDDESSSSSSSSSGGSSEESSSADGTSSDSDRSSESEEGAESSDSSSSPASSSSSSSSSGDSSKSDQESSDSEGSSNSN